MGNSLAALLVGPKSALQQVLRPHEKESRLLILKLLQAEPAGMLPGAEAT